MDNEKKFKKVNRHVLLYFLNLLDISRLKFDRIYGRKKQHDTGKKKQ